MQPRIPRLATILTTAYVALVTAAGTASATDAVYEGWSQTEVGSRPTMDKLFSGSQKTNPDKKLEVVGFPYAPAFERVHVFNNSMGKRLSP